MNTNEPFNMTRPMNDNSEEFEKQISESSASPAGSIADLVPTNWLDPLLTGPDAALPPGHDYGPQDIERLLLAIKARIQAADAQRR